MKKQLSKFFILFGIITTMTFLGCPQPSNNSPTKNYDSSNDGSRSENLNKLFDPMVLAESTVTITRSEWNKLLQYYDWDKYNETSVKASFSIKKGNDINLEYDNINFRVRGNTSRIRPQIGNGAGNNDYVQAHFKVSFKDDDNADQKNKDSQSVKYKGLKGINLKRFRNDYSYAGEVFSYNFFRENGIWTAPRSSYTTLTINIVDGSSTEKVYYGVYEMVEEINTQYLKERTNAQGGGKFNSSDGNLWKCAWADSANGWHGAAMSNSDETFGVESKEFLKDSNGNYTGAHENKTYNYDLKTNKENINQATADFKHWIKELNSLTGEDSIKAWYESHMDIDLFLKTYAVNVVLGMWDDYWVNQNNYYFYIDDNGAAYFIPYDYDNVLWLTASIINPIEQDPFKWGNLDGSRPLINKILSIPEYKELYAYWLNYIVDSKAYANAKNTINAYQDLIRNKIYSPNLKYCNPDNNNNGEGNVDVSNGIFISGTYIENGYFNPKKEVIKNACKPYLKDDPVEPTPTPTPTPTPGDLIMPYTYNSSTKECTFIFNPSDYSGTESLVYDDSTLVFVRGAFTTDDNNIIWDVCLKFRMNYDSEKNYYTLSTTIEHLADGLEFKFYEPTNNKWWGLNQIRSELKNLLPSGTENGNFVLE